MKYTLLFLCSFCILLASCKDTKTDPNQLADDSTILSMNDSISNLVMSFTTTSDTSSLVQAMEISERVLKLDLTDEGQHFGTVRKVQILTLLGNKKEAFLLQGKVTNQDPNSVDRLTHNGIRSLLENKTDSAEIYFNNGLSQCHKTLALNPENKEIYLNMIGIHLYKGDKKKAIEEIDKAIASYPAEQSFVAFKAGIDKMYEDVQLFIKSNK